jgi:hypothetical protein
MRFPPAVVTRGADGWVENIHDLLPSDGRFKLVVLAGDATSAGWQGRLDDVGRALCEPAMWLPTTPIAQGRLVDHLGISYGGDPVAISATMSTSLHVDWTRLEVPFTRDII